MDYIDRIKHLKSEKKITNDELSEMTGIPLGTLSKILAGISDSPKLSNVVAICDALGCSLDYIVNGTPENNNNYSLELGEIKLIEKFRRLDSHGMELVTLVLEKECERLRSAEYSVSTASARVEQASSGKAKILRPSASATAKHKGIVIPAEAKLDQGLGRRPITLYDLPVSAGPGVFLVDASADAIMIPNNYRTEGADFAVRISGKSMEPRFKDGDILLVQDSETVENGELGIFILDGSGYFKRYGGDRLISLNPEFGDIMLKDFAEVSCCGKVIGKLRRK